MFRSCINLLCFLFGHVYDIHPHYLSERNWEMNLFCDDFIDMPFFFQVRWGSGSIVSVRWVHLNNPRLWECGKEWECNTQTASTLPHQSDYKIHFYDLMWPSLILHCFSTLLAFILVHNDLSIRSDCRSFGERFWRFPIRLLWSIHTCFFITIWMPSSPQRLFFCPHWNSYSRMFCDTEHNKLAQAPETALMSFGKWNAYFGNET